MMFESVELEYLRSQRLGRLATLPPRVAPASPGPG
jgi:hypothetical protein